MLNYIWAGLILISLIFAFFTGKLPETIAGGLDGAKDAVTMVLGLCGMMCLWSGLMAVAKKSGLVEKLQKLLSPVLGFLFRDLKRDSAAMSAICANVVANIMGLSNASTPLGLAAMEELDKENGRAPRASRAMCMFIVLNTASIQLIPSTIIAIRQAQGSTAPTSIMVPVWIASLCALATGIFAVKLCEKGGARKSGKRVKKGGRPC